MAQNIPESVVDAVCDGDLVAVSAWLKNGGNEFVDETLEGHPFILPSLKHLISQAIEHSANASAIVELLLQAGAQPRLEFLLAAIEKENVEAALLLVAHGADVSGSQDGRTALHSVTEYASLGALARQDELVHALLEAGAPVDAQDGYHGKTPLMYAAWSGFTNPLVLSCVEIKILRRVRAESSRRPPRHRRDTCSMAWRCRFFTARRSQRGHVIAEK